MTYQLKDLQGQGLKEDYVFESLEEIETNLRDFHSVDVANAGEMSLIELCDIGSWQVIEENGLEITL